MKPKFHLNKRAGARPAASTHGAVAAGHTIALVDERYLGWLAGQHGQSPAALQRAALLPVLSGLTRALGPEAQLLRACVFADQPALDLVDDVLVRTVPAHAVDGGLGLVRAMGQELLELARRGAVSAVLLASDDERLIPYIDEAQWRGLKVAVVTDEASQDFAKLKGEDPSWARLLLQADRRLALGALALQALITPGAEAPLLRTWAPRQEAAEVPDDAAADLPPDDDWREQVLRVIDTWWQEETPDSRLDLFEEMQNSQGVPPETDRHLLLRVRRELARTLSFQEKKAMREMIRATVLAQPPVVPEDSPAP